ncbi:MAG: hypothetical protein MAG458_00785 [Nitrosopumilus sp.]|nr:hypothetical protein [Nitrosopumilus sp.]
MPISASLDSDIYPIGETLILSGKISNPVEKSEFYTDSIILNIVDVNGDSLSIVGHDADETKTNRGVGVVNVDETFTILPDPSGHFTFNLSITRAQFESGDYVIHLNYGTLAYSIPFSVTDPVDISELTLTLEKEVYGLGEIVNLSGLIPPTGEPAISISLTKPDGSIHRSGTNIDNQSFSWSWVAPISEKTSTNVSERSSNLNSNLGLYKINVYASGYEKDIFFKVSLDPENDVISKDPLFVTAEKSMYIVGEKLKIVGSTLPHSSDGHGLIVPQRVILNVQDMTFPYDVIFESAVYSKQNGYFETTFDLPATVFTSGEYKINAMYGSLSEQSTFSVVNDFTFGLDADVSLTVSTDKSQYFPGDIVTVTGKPNKLIYLDKFDVSIIQKSDTEVTCGSFICGVHQGPIISILPSPSGSFEHSFVIGDSDSSLGLYEITVDADFETKSLQFSVVPPPKLDTVIEKETRISEKNLSILTEEKLFQDTSIAPRVLSGSLITPLRDDQSNVNLKVSTEFGLCIIGSDENCLVHDSTRSQGQIYETVIIDDMSFNVRYSGPDVRLEKFSILPTSSDDFLPDSNWNIDVIKDEQISRLYYKVTYKTLE